MPVYTYTALSENGTAMTGEGVASTAEELTQQLTSKGLLVRSVARKQSLFSQLRRKRIKPEVFLLFNQELSALVRAGLTIPDALKLATAHPDNALLSQVLKRVLEDVRGGVLFSEACARHSEVFDGLYIDRKSVV